MLTEGHIIIHRKIIDWEWYKNVNTYRVFTHLLYTANWYESEWHGQKIKRGQRVISIKHLSSEVGLTTQQTRTALNNLQKTNEITIKTTNKYSLVTVVNYDIYQFNINEITNKITNKITSKTTNNQQTTQQQINKLNKNKLNNLYKYIKGEEEKFEDLNEKDLISLRNTLKNLELYVEDDSFLPEEMIFELKLKYYVISQLYKSSYRVYLNDLTSKLFTFKFLDAQKYCPIGSENEISDFMSYLIVCLRKEMKINGNN